MNTSFMVFKQLDIINVKFIIKWLKNFIMNTLQLIMLMLNVQMDTEVLVKKTFVMFVELLL